MAGIAGVVGWGVPIPVLEEMSSVMGDSLEHRGNSERSYWSALDVAMTHNRLAIVDLNVSRQPFVLRDAHAEVVAQFDGKIWNYREIWSALSLGQPERAHITEVETIARAYRALGTEMFTKISGDFAISIWDARARQLHLARDRTGVKPLYMWRNDALVMFASEPKGILACRAVPRLIDSDGLREFLAGTATSRGYLLKDIRQLEPGTFMTFSEGSESTQRYWRLRRPDIGGNDVEGAVTQTLLQVMSDQMRSDVPIGALSSGGLDSSTLLAHCSEGLKETYCLDIRVNGSRDSGSESDVAASLVMAEEHNVPHRLIRVDIAEIADPAVRRAAVHSRDEPSGLGDMESSMALLYRQIASRVSVVFSGEGADELFGGYALFDPTDQLLDTAFPWHVPNIRAVGTAVPAPATLRRGLSEALRLDEFIADSYVDAVRDVPPMRYADAVERRMARASYLFVTRYMPQLLARADRLSMAYGLETRVPFADHRLVEAVALQPWYQKTTDGVNKGLLRKIVQKRLQPKLVERAKAPFPSPESEAYTALVMRQAESLLREGNGNNVFDVLSRGWLERICLRPIESISVPLRFAVERYLNFAMWLELYRPTIQCDR